MSVFSALMAATSEFDHFVEFTKMKTSRISGLFGFLPLGGQFEIAII